MLRNLYLYLLLFLVPVTAFSTHIVGGVLNYAYNGNNVYTITLRLFRDCGPNTAGFPNSITISVKGNNGANFNPSKNITISLGSVTSVTAATDPCAIPPNPMPCVQMGIYTKTVSLPPNNGGYHLFYQLEARNLSLTNINSSCNCIGESFYAYIPNNTVSSNSNSNAVFNSFPPLFLCVNQGFVIDHSASDADGDSLVYSLYAPYNGDNNNGPLDPSFSNNVASFTSVNYLPGYTANNPLGASPFTINPVTGILTGTPGLVGQFVVGVKVKEYRNGVLISETIRDFQFNVLNCPAPPPQLAVGNQTINNGCSKVITAQGLAVNTTTWYSVSPGVQGAYNSYLSCNNSCLTTTAVSSGLPPPFVDYVVCGVQTNCLQEYVCDTFRIHFHPPLSVSIAPSNPALCNGQTATTITAVGSGGSPPYSYLWNNVNPSQVISVGVGTYNVKLSDASGCPPVFASAVVTSYSVPVSITAVPSLTRCSANPVAALGATTTGASGVMWSGGTGTFSPNNTSSSNVFYTPSASELTAGGVTLVVTTTGSGLCPAASETVTIRYSNFTGTVVPTTTAVSCFGLSDGKAAVSVLGGQSPHSFTWQVVPVQTGSLLNNKPAGVYSYSLSDNIGCSKGGTVSITQPAILGLSHTVTNASCFGTANGSATVTASGGTSPYTYSWMPVSQTSSIAINLAAGTYSCRVTDNRNCITTSVVTITQPASLSIASSQTNIACSSGSTGAISTTVTGGTAPYSYSWTPGGNTTPGLSGIPAGTYVLRVSDQKNCQANRTITIAQPPLLTAAMSSTNETCNYLNNGRVSVTAGGGAPGYTYLWSPGGATGSLVTNLAAGVYSVTVLDANNCAVTGSVQISQPPVLSVSLINYSPVRCFGASDGSVIANANGGVPGYSFSWSPAGTTSASLTNRPAGSYTVTVTDLNTCTATAVQVITQPAALVQTALINTVSCSGGNNASVTLSVTGGTGPYSYLWLPGAQNTATLSAATAGNYTAIVSDANNCTVAATYSVSEPLPLIVDLTPSPVSCFGGNNGVVTATASGGHAPYTYSWSTGATTKDLISVPAGIYTITVTDNLLCATIKTVTVTEPPLLAVSVSFTNESCDYLDNGFATAFASGGTGPYSYSWQPGNVSGANNTGLAAGTYSVFVTDVNSCTTFSQVVIQQPLPLVPVATSSAVSCFGGSDGIAFVQTTGGTPNYQYTFAPSGSTLSTASGLSAGIHSVTVADGNGCVAGTTVEVTEPAALSATPSTTNVSCFSGNDGVISVTTAGGTGPYSFFWNPGGTNTESVTGLSAGSYTVFITDANSCTLTEVYNVTEPTQLTVTTSFTAVSCFAGSDGSAAATGAGGTPPYLFNWSNGPTTQVVNNISQGIYTVTVTDNLLCFATQTVEVTEPTQFQLAVTFTNETCDYLDNGLAEVNGSGGTAPYSYTWSPGGANTTLIAGLASGIYTVEATDAMMCPATLTVEIDEPAALKVIFDPVSNVSCSGYSDGTALAVPSGGTPNYSYAWSSGTPSSALNTSLSAGNHTVTITDDNSCVATGTVTVTEPLPLIISANTTTVQCAGGSDGAISISINGGTPPYSNLIMPGNITGSNFSNLSAGSYTIYSTDVKGCVNSGTVTVDEALALSTVSSHTNPSCGVPNGSALISVTSGGVPPFTYSWMPVAQTTSLVSGLGAGSYTVTVTDSDGCVSTKIVDVSNTSAPVVIVASATNVSCFGGSDAAITTSVSGGTPPFTYSWSPVGGTGSTATNLQAGYYSVAVTDDVGCVGVVSSSLVSQPKAISAVVTPSAVSCNGGSNGSASALIFGGTPAHTLSWSSGVPSGNSVSGLSAGNYSLTVTDSKLCVYTTTFDVTEPTTLSLSVSSTSVSCFGGSDGDAVGTASGGISPYSYSWTPVNVGSQQLQNVPAGVYSLTARDVKGCTTSNTVAVVEPPQILLASLTKNSDCSLANGQATVDASGGNGGFNFTWIPSGASSSVAVGLSAGSHTVHVRDVNLCPAMITLTISDNPAPTIAVTTVTNVSCFGGSDGAAQATVTGGSGPFVFSWSPSGANSATATGLGIGQQTLVVVSANNCSVTSVSPVITQPLPVILNVTTSSVLCFGGSSGSATVAAFGGTGAYSYTWQAGLASGNSVSGLTQGTYTVEARDANNCPAVKSFTIAEPLLQLTATIASNSVSCNGGSTGSATVTAAGGTAPYSYLWSPVPVSSHNISALAAGIYTVQVTDFNNCPAQQTVSIAEPPPLIVTPGSIPSDCSAANGQASVSASGGIAPYNYQWSPAGGNAPLAQNLLAGTYSVTVTDGNGCVTQSSVNVSDLPAPSVTITSVTSVSCHGGANGTAIASVTGGSSPFTFLWSAGSGATATVTGLPAGQHTVTVTSANNCTVTAVTPLVVQPSSVVISFNTSAVSCFGNNNGSGVASVFGGTPPYTYSWSPVAGSTNTLQGLFAGTYSLEVTDGNNCVNTSTMLITQPTGSLTLSVNASSVLCFGGSTGSATVTPVGGTAPYSFNWNTASSTASNVAGLSAGIYTVSAIDNKGCTENATVSIAEPALPLTLMVNPTNVSCFGQSGGSASVVATGGTPVYTYSWSAGVSTSSLVTGLPAGNYTVQAKDQNQCASVSSFTLTEPSLLTGTLIATHPSCDRLNGILNAQLSGGTGPFSYQWSAGTSTGPNVAGLGPGGYTLTATDAQNCTSIVSATLINIPGPTVTVTGITPVSCFGLADGGATVSATGVSPPYLYQWIPLGGTTAGAQHLSAGDYTVGVTDSLGCSASATVQITQPQELGLDIQSVVNVSCKGLSDGVIQVSAVGGTSPYSYAWSEGSDGPVADSLVTGTYIVNVVDNNNCSYSASVNITEPAQLVANASIVRQILCFGGTGDASVSVTGGTLPYSMNWTSAPPQNGNVLVSVPFGGYVVFITDSKGCTTSDTVVFNQPTQIATNVSKVDTICAGTNSVLTASAAGGIGGYSFNWAPVGAVNSGTLLFVPTNDISYTVVAFDQNGCAGTDAVSDVYVYELSDSDFTLSGYSPVCPGQATTLEAKISGNPGPVTYTWSHGLPAGPGPFVVQPLGATVYSVAVSNKCGVVVRRTTTVEIAPPPVVNMIADSLDICAPGSIQFHETGTDVNSTDPVAEWIWDFGNGNISAEQEPYFYFTTAGTYPVNLTVITDRGCVGTATTPLSVKVHPQPEAAFSLNKTVLQLPYDDLQCTNLSTGASTFNWEFGDGTTSTLPNPKVRLQIVGQSTVQLIAISDFGCRDTAVQVITTSSELVFPNAFTPNEEGSSGGSYDVSSLANDVFFPYTSGVTEYSLQIFNRWGELIFESTDLKIGWDGYYRGVICQQGVYVWKASAALGDGKKFSKSGTLTLLRK